MMLNAMSPMMRLSRLLVLWIAGVVCSQPQPQPLNSQFSIDDMLSDSQAVEASKRPTFAPSFGSTGGKPIDGAAAMQAILGLSPSGTTSLSAEAMDVVSGLIEAFMHKVRLLPGEKKCFQKNAGQIAGDIVATGLDIVIVTKALMKTNSSSAAGNKSTIPGKIVSAGLDSAMKLAHLVTLSSALLQDCVHGDSLNMLTLTGKHLMSAQYLGHRFLVNGVDIARGLADSIVAFEAKDYHRFGSDIGTALRKILLSNASNGTAGLPEGVPEQEIIQKVTEGIMGGFFATGSGIVITDKADPRVNIVLNLHQCITGNSLFFKEIWLGVWDLFAQLAVNGQQHGLALPPTGGSMTIQGQPEQPKWTGELMMALLQFPMALQTCGMDVEKQTMFARAVQTLGDVNVKVVFPKDPIQADVATNRMAKAVRAWTDWKFRTFGKEVGKLLREVATLTFPRNNSVVSMDNIGKLRNDLLGYSVQTPAILSQKQSSRFFATLVAGCFLSVIVALVAVRSLWEAHYDSGDDAPFVDIEMERDARKSSRS